MPNDPPTTPSRALAGKEFAFTGRLASMPREEAQELIEERGARFVRYPRRSTSYLVVGGSGAPLARDGQPTRKLARTLVLNRDGASIEILDEEAFLDLAGLVERQDAVRREHTLAQLARVLDLDPSRLRRWVRSGILRPTRVVHRLELFEYREVAAAKTVADLVERGISPARIQKSLEELRRWLPHADSVLRAGLLAEDRRLLVRLEDGKIADSHGQLWFDFDAPETVPTLEVQRPESSGDWIECGLKREEAGDLEGAERAYREAISRDPEEAQPRFNLGNVLYARDEVENAAAAYLAAIERDGDYVEAWNNLGTALADLEEWDEAIRAFEKAVEIAPFYDDARFNLADTLHRLGRGFQALTHWREYLRLDPHSEWADRARARIDEIVQRGTP